MHTLADRHNLVSRWLPIRRLVSGEIRELMGGLPCLQVIILFHCIREPIDHVRARMAKDGLNHRRSSDTELGFTLRGNATLFSSSR